MINNCSTNGKDVLVSICVITYNQDRFIRECLDSILSQQVDFRYEIVIGDDGSTDSTPIVINEYKRLHPDCIIPIFSDINHGISSNYKRVLDKCTGKYIALCEGDDYWIGSTRLQKQIDFLEGHPGYGFVGGNVNLLQDGRFTYEPYNYITSQSVEDEWELLGNVFEYAKYGPVTRTVTLCFRKSLIEPFISIEGVGNDLVLQTILSKYSMFAKLPYAIGVYRQNGISTSKDSFKSIQRYSHWRFECLSLQKQLFPEDCNWASDEITDNCNSAGGSAKQGRDRKTQAIRNSIKSIKYKNKKSYKYSGNLFSFFLLGVMSRWCSLAQEL